MADFVEFELCWGGRVHVNPEHVGEVWDGDLSGTTKIGLRNTLVVVKGERRSILDRLTDLGSRVFPLASETPDDED